MKKVLAILITAMLLMTFSSCEQKHQENNSVSGEQNLQENKWNGYSDEELNAAFLSMSGSELIDEANKIATTEDPKTSNTFIIAVSTLVEKADSFSEDEIYSIVSNDEYADDVRCAVIDMCQLRKDKDTILNQDKYKRMLTDKSVSSTIKNNLLISIDFESEEDKTMLEDIIKGDEEEIIFWAFRRLDTFDRDRAVRIADEIIADYKNATIKQMQGANAVKAWYIRDQIKAGKENEKDLREQIDALKEMCFYGFELAADSQIKDSFIVYLADTLDLDVLGAIIRHDAIDDQLKEICVDLNYPTLMRVLQNDLPEEDIDIVIEALNIKPFNQTYYLLENNIRAKNQEQELRLYDVLLTIEVNGVDGNESLLEY